MSSQPTLTPFLRKLERHSSLAAADQDAILALPHAVRELSPSSYFVREGDVPTHCCVLLSGFALRHKVAGDGSRQILAVHVVGDAIDLQHVLLEEADHNVQALGPVTFASIPRQAVAEIAARHPQAGRALWRDTLIDASVFREWIVNVGQRDARTRLLHLICELALRQRWAGLTEGEQYELPLTQEQLADATGLTAVHVNRVLKGLDADGVIQRAKRRVIIDDWDLAARTGDFDPKYLHGRVGAGATMTCASGA